MFHYKVVYTTAEGKRRMSDCAHSITIANGVAQRRLAEGATNVVIEVTQENEEDKDEDDPTWPPIEITA